MKLADKPMAMLRRLAMWAAPLLLVITVFSVPVTNSRMKLFQACLLVAILVVWLVSFRGKARLGLIVVMISVAGLFLLPERRTSSSEDLVKANTRALLHYDGVTYWWGGENSMGIDCSGLIRRGMIDASLLTGLRHLDGSLLRASAVLWWHDTSADALGDGYRGYTVPVTKAKSLNELDHSLVKAGDLAVTGGGSHILAYLGNKQWIQADPTANKVIVEIAPSKNGWFSRQVNVVRWRWMSGP